MILITKKQQNKKIPLELLFEIFKAINGYQNLIPNQIVKIKKNTKKIQQKCIHKIKGCETFLIASKLNYLFCGRAFIKRLVLHKFLREMSKNQLKRRFSQSDGQALLDEQSKKLRHSINEIVGTTNAPILPLKKTLTACSSLTGMIKIDSYYYNSFTNKLGPVPIYKGNFSMIPLFMQRYMANMTEHCNPKGIYICDGSENEAEELTSPLVQCGAPLTRLRNENLICRTGPFDCNSVASKTWMVTNDKSQSVDQSSKNFEQVGNWMSEELFAGKLHARFPNCMTGRVMYVVMFSMGPIGSLLSKIGVLLTDCEYIVLSMRIMTRIITNPPSTRFFVKGIHSVGLPHPIKEKVISNWPCNPELVFTAHRPSMNEIWSFGSGYAGNPFLGNKLFTLRIASTIARDEGWLAENMLIIGVNSPDGKEHFIAAAFPSACGKTNFAMLKPTLPGWKVHFVSDAIAWMKFDKSGHLYAINPEAGFFGYAPGTSMKTNPVAIATFRRNSIFTNVAEINGKVYWEGLGDEISYKTNVNVTDWMGNPWKLGESSTPAAHPNSSFCAPAKQCPNIHPDWESPKGVLIEAIIFGSRRTEGVPLVFETFSWEHGILTGSSMKAETSAAKNKTKTIVHDPMAMRLFLGYNFGKYLDHWCNLKRPRRRMPKIFHVNWFRKSSQGKFLWPGYGENIRVIDWIIRRLAKEDGIGLDTAIGTIPKQNSFNLNGLDHDIKWDELMSVPKDYWIEESKEMRKFLEEEANEDLPAGILKELCDQEKRINCS